MDNTLNFITLNDEQALALKSLRSGSVLAGGVGTGKTYISIFWAAHQSKDKHIYVITEAVKRDKIEEGSIKPDWQESFENCGISEDRYTVDSWNNIKKYEHVTNALFLFDEQHAISYNPYSKTSWGVIFVNIAIKNEWILASATPGDEWINYLPIFIANRFYKSKTQFVNEHVVFDQYSKFPKIKMYVNLEKLEDFRKRILVPVTVLRTTTRHRVDVMTDYDKDAFNYLLETRFNVEKDEPYNNPSEFAAALRKISNTSGDRINKAYEIMFGNRRIIVFYRNNYEREILLNMAEELGKPYAEWTGHKHQPIPEGDDWTYICQYTAASKAWSCVSTNAMMFFSVSGSYNTVEQCEGRIDRLNTKYTDLYYYYLQSNSKLDKATMRSLKKGKDFNELSWLRGVSDYFKPPRRNV